MGFVGNIIGWAATRMTDWSAVLHVLVGVVCASGILMAFFSEQEHDLGIASKLFRSHEGSKSQTVVVEKAAHPSILENFLAGLGAIVAQLQSGDLLERTWSQIVNWWQLLKLLWTARAMKSAANSRRQFFYLMEKVTRNLPIEPRETEVKSYLDLKKHIGESWPFMWGVSNVKHDKIECDGYECVPFSSYSYLDLLRCNEVQESAIAAARQYSSGNHGPRMLGGNARVLIQLEKVIADFFGRGGCLLCSAGFLACMSAPCAIASEGDIMFADARMHASVRSGLKLCGAKVMNFRHNDFDHLDKLCKKNRKKFNRAWIIIESVYSMDGDIADLPAAYAVARKHDLKILLDEAHGLGVVGKTGRGLEEHYGMQGVCDVICGTFSKSIASVGGYICSTKELISFMDFHAPGNVFSAPLPAYCAGAALKSFELIDRESWRVSKAQENSRYLRHALSTGLGEWPADYLECDKYYIEGDPASTVIPLVFKDDMNRVIRVATELKKRGFMVAAVAFPACPLRYPRFRVTATTAYDRPLMDRFVRELIRTCLVEGPSESRDIMRSSI